MEASAVRKISNLLIAILFVTLAASVTTRAQNPAQAGADSSQLAANSPSITANRSTTQGLVSSLSNLPDADTLIYVNPQRILNEVVPKFMPPKDVEGMRKGFDEVKKNVS